VTYRALDSLISAATLPEALRHWARSSPESRAVADAGQALGYGELAVRVRNLAGRLARAGVEPGDRVALIGDNSVEWVLGFLAALDRGAIAVPLNNRLSRTELSRQLALSDPRVVLAGEPFLTRVEHAGPPAGARTFALEPDDTRSVWDLPAGPADSPAPTPEAPAVISFTSGTTGSPHGATITHGALVLSAAAYAEKFETTAADRTLALVPMFHNTGFVDQLTQMVLVGGSLDLLPRFGVGAALDALERSPSTYLIAVPSILRLLMLDERADAAFGECRVAAYGGSSMPTTWIDELGRRWPHLRPFNVYGLTEFTSCTHILGPEEVRARADSVGRPVCGVRHRIVDAGGDPLPAGVVGEIEVAGPMRMAGYWRDPDGTAAVLHGEWLRTGDLGAVDADDYLVVSGRSADVINRGGEKIHAAQVEAALSRVPAVADVAVVGAPHPVFQERVVACVVARGAAEFDEQAALGELAERVPDYALPERFLMVDELPRNAAGKVDRGALRAVAAEAVGAERR
jgi:long-chain acyl-CoA synthetase